MFPPRVCHGQSKLASCRVTNPQPGPFKTQIAQLCEVVGRALMSNNQNDQDGKLKLEQETDSRRSTCQLRGVLGLEKERLQVVQETNQA